MVRGFPRRAEPRFKFGNPSLGSFKTLPQRPDQSVRVGMAQVNEVAKLGHPRLESVRRLHEGLQSLLSIRRMDRCSQIRNRTAEYRFSQSEIETAMREIPHTRKATQCAAGAPTLFVVLNSSVSGTAQNARIAHIANTSM